MILISPAKNLNIETEQVDYNLTIPKFLKKTENLVSLLKKLSLNDLQSLMKVSDSLSKLNFERYRKFEESNLKAAAFLFSGDTFNGLSIRSLNKQFLDYAQNNLRILSGLYGILRPFDLIKPYRLEMGTNIKETLGKDLYEFWSNEILKSLENDIIKVKSNFLFNLSSAEYFKSVNYNKLDVEVINFDFKKIIDGKMKNIGMYIKKLRGMMAKFLIENKVTKLNQIKKFKMAGFRFESFDKKNNNFLFLN